MNFCSRYYLWVIIKQLIYYAAPIIIRIVVYTFTFNWLYGYATMRHYQNKSVAIILF